ncbi:ATPase [Saccharolobus solfataricus]|uniref:ATP synthase subunit G (AtpG) n=3 Tax=Saccharolobus solfataricus TaxID=2287 RepID=Q97ZR2_SACS2|nr:ATPase [Saccharolobus solfataricus]AAK40882.1 ATP synthase subunit G (atpG) [Saccharolobus solfataricus P2]AKA73912.1 ATPase [Saccharolobus solfataricus]AKA76610.1 ATPase [Saccharolobus solfataricus]AKA79303.1 ATPase [Saccharolobus solfataricus]AZF68388.1 ATPase [Saccharolobus solfataricus]
MDQDKYLQILRNSLEEKKSEILKNINMEYEKLLKNRLSQLDEVKRKVLKELS